MASGFGIGGAGAKAMGILGKGGSGSPYSRVGRLSECVNRG